MTDIPHGYDPTKDNILNIRSVPDGGRVCGLCGAESVCRIELRMNGLLQPVKWFCEAHGLAYKDKLLTDLAQLGFEP